MKRTGMVSVIFHLGSISNIYAMCCVGIAPPEAAKNKSSAEFREKTGGNTVCFTDWTNRETGRQQRCVVFYYYIKKILENSDIHIIIDNARSYPQKAF